jgi:hypothetical protein
LEAKMTRVVHFHDVATHWDAKRQRWDSDEYVYIGRRNRQYNLPESEWANPFHITEERGRADVITAYRAYIHARWGKINLEALRGKTLVCWCKKGGRNIACHGDVLLEMLGEITPIKQLTLF